MQVNWDFLKTREEKLSNAFCVFFFAIFRQVRHDKKIRFYWKSIVDRALCLVASFILLNEIYWLCIVIIFLVSTEICGLRK